MSRSTFAPRCAATTGELLTSASSRRLSTSFSRLRSATFAGAVSPRRGQVLDGGEDGLQLDVVGVLLAELRPHLLQPGAEHVLVGARVQGEAVVVVADGEGPALVLELQLTPVQHHAVLVAEDREQDLVPQLGLHRVPLDVEEVRVERGRAVLQHVLPERVARGDAHVVGHRVEHQLQPVAPERVGQRDEAARRRPAPG